MKISKILSVFLAAFLLMAVAVPFTASAAGDASITINYPAGYSINGQVFKAYKIFDVTTDGESYAYTTDPRFEHFTGFPDSSMQTIHEYLTKGAETIDDTDMAKLAKALWTYIGDMEPDAAETGSTGQSVTLSGLDHGYYLIYSMGSVPGQNEPIVVVAANSLVTVTSGNISINAKVDSPAIDKFVNNHVTGTWEAWTDIHMGTNAEFKLTSMVPNMQGYEAYSFIVHDIMSAGLTFNNDVAVKVNGANYTHFTVKTVADDASIAPDTFRIIFDPDEFIQLTPGHAIEITYSGLLNEGAVIGAPGNPNKVNLEYSNDPYTNSTGKTPEDTVIVYTFDLEIFKYTGEFSNPEALKGAEFELRIGDEDGDAIRVIDLKNGNYRLAAPEDNTEDVTTTLISADNGKIYVEGLDAGEYVLVETKAPDGFNLLPGWKTIVILHENADGEYSMTVDTDPTNVVNVLNNKGPEFPNTGGVGTTIFYIVSAILTAGLAAFFVLKKRRNLLSAE